LKVCPFRGIRYNSGIVKDLAEVICPPYDVITPSEQKLYYERSDYNVIRLEYAMEEPEDSKAGNKYNRAAITFQQWLKQGVLEVDESPAFYLHDHYFTYSGVRRRRRGLIARVKLEPWYSGIHPHEETFAKAKIDRLQLMRACQANFSPLFALYQDPEQQIAHVLSEASRARPLFDFSEHGEEHIVWAIADSRFRQEISRLLTPQTLYMADGHHRYETALIYQGERAQGVSSAGGNEAFNYVMMTLVDFSDPGLVIFPIYRLVRGIAAVTLAELKSRLGQFFILESSPSSDNYISHLKSKIVGEVIFGVLGLESDSLVMLKPRQGISGVMPEGRSQVYKKVDLSLLNHVILEQMLGIVEGEGNITYTVDVDEAYQRVKSGEFQLAFLVAPPRLETIKTIADVKDKMPRKSTYFYPKLPAGLVINSLEWL
jgi:uncharacterized protein (DUF1015 family)